MPLTTPSGSVWTPKLDGTEAFYAPLWHPKTIGDTFYSFDRNRHLCTVTGAVWGKYGRAFDGNDKIVIPDSSVWSFGSGNFTIVIWFYPTAASRMFLFNGKTDHWLGFSYHYQGTRNIGIYASSNGSTWDLINADPAGNGIGTISLTLNGWNHIRLARIGNNWTTHINDVKDIDITVAGTLVTVNETKLIGVHSSASLWVVGTIGELGAYWRGLSIAEGSRNYQDSKWRYNS